MVRLIPCFAVVLGLLAATPMVSGQPADAEEAPDPALKAIAEAFAKAVAETRAVESGVANKATRRGLPRAVPMSPELALSKQHREQLAEMSDEQVETHMRELIREASEAEGKWQKAAEAAKSLDGAYGEFPDEEKPELYVLHVEAVAKSRVLQKEKERLSRSTNEAIDECLSRHRKQLEQVPTEQLRVRLRDLVAERNAAQQRYETLKAAPDGDKGTAAGAYLSAKLEWSRLDRQVYDAADIYTKRLMAEQQ